MSGIKVSLRPLRHEDEESLALQGNNPKIAAGFGMGFPSPLTREDARRWIEEALSHDPVTEFAIVVDGGPAAGVIHYSVQGGVRRQTSVVGYWVGEEYWRRGVATEALKQLCQMIWKNTQIIRIEVRLSSLNQASARVAEKAGFSREACHFKALMDFNDQISDEWVYVLLRESEFHGTQCRN